MSGIYKPESIDDLWQQSFTVLQNAYNSGYIIGVEQGERIAEERIINLLEHMPRTDNDRTVDAPTLIALIKGENK